MENKEGFKPLPFWKELFLKKEELPDYYRLKRKYLHEHGKSISGMKWRELIHPVMLSIMTIDTKIFSRQTMEIIRDDRMKTEKPKIYAITHMGMDDYQVISEAIKEHQIPLSADPERMYRTLDGKVLDLNGIIYCDTDDKEDRGISQSTAIELLKSGKNLLIYPEGVWNITPNLLMLPIFPGIIRMAKETGAEIIPCAIEQYEKHFIVSIGKNFTIEDKKYNNEEEEKKYIEEKKQELRDIMATLKWEVISKRPQEKRKDIGDYETYNRNFKDERLNEWHDPKTSIPYYNDEIVEKRTFRVKNITFSKDAFNYFGKIKLNRNNAFLFRKDPSMPKNAEEDKERKLK